MKEKILDYYNETCHLGSENVSCTDHSGDLKQIRGKVLDLGCGTLENGYHVFSGVHVYALDINEKAIEKARIKAAQDFKDIPIEFFAASIESIPFSENFFDGAFSNCVVNNSKDKPLVFSEIYRVLKPGAKLILSDAFSKELLPEEISSNPELVASCFGGAETIGSYVDYLVQTGFSNISVRRNRNYLKNGFDFISATIFADK